MGRSVPAASNGTRASPGLVSHWESERGKRSEAFGQKAWGENSWGRKKEV